VKVDAFKASGALSAVLGVFWKYGSRKSGFPAFRSRISGGAAARGGVTLD
jgi:hypothetical protein